MTPLEVQNAIQLARFREATMAYDPTAESTRPYLPPSHQKPVTVPNGADPKQIDRLATLCPDRSEDGEITEAWPQPQNLEQARLRAIYSGETHGN